MRGDRPVPRIAFLEGVLELMRPSKEHERIKSLHWGTHRGSRAPERNRAVALRRLDSEKPGEGEPSGAVERTVSVTSGGHPGPGHRGGVDARSVVFPNLDIELVVSVLDRPTAFLAVKALREAASRLTNR